MPLASEFDIRVQPGDGPDTLPPIASAVGAKNSKPKPCIRWEMRPPEKLIRSPSAR